MEPRQIYDVFLSYHTGDQGAVEVIAERLRGAGLLPFLDRWSLIPGEPWQEALETALAQSRTCAIFLGPSGFGPWQNEEMRIALERRVHDARWRVIPVLLPGANAGLLKGSSSFLGRLSFVDFGAGISGDLALERLIAGIRGISTHHALSDTTSYRSMAPSPETFVHRHEFDHVRTHLLQCSTDTSNQLALTSAVALKGAGGFGKTSLAQALANDPVVRGHFPDGVLWTTMGETLLESDRLIRVRDLIRWWYRAEPPHFETLLAAGAYLREMLAGKRVLVVVDDVWHSSDLEPFRGIASGSALLATTRDSTALSAQFIRLEIDAMQVSEAVTVLTDGVAGADLRKVEALAKRLGEWPLLLGLINRQLRELVRTSDFERALHDIEESLDAAGLTAFDREDATAREMAVRLTIESSLRRLKEAERERYNMLAVFPEDADVPTGVLARLWGLDRHDTLRSSTRLAELSLLLRLDRISETVRLHDVFRQYLITKQTPRVCDLQASFLSRVIPASGKWKDLEPADIYLWRNLAFHLQAAGQHELFRTLLLDLEFLEAKLRATDVSVLLSDYDLAGPDEAVLIVQRTMQLSAHILVRNPSQLAGQIAGRIRSGIHPDLDELRSAARTRTGLYPRQATLTAPDGPLVRTLEGHRGSVNVVTRIDERRVASGSDDQTVRVWSLETGRTLFMIDRHKAPITTIRSLDDNHMVSASARDIVVWEVESGRIIRSFASEIYEGIAIRDLAVLEPQQVVCIGTAPSSSNPPRAAKGAWVVNFDTGRLVQGIARAGMPLALLSASTGAVAFMGWDGIQLWTSDDSVRTLYSGWVYTGALAKDELFVAALRTIARLDSSTGQVHASVSTDSRATSMTMLGESRILCAFADKTVGLYSADTLRVLGVFSGHTDEVLDVEAVDRSRFVSASADGTLRLWHADRYSAPQTGRGHKNAVRSLTVADDGHIASASDDHTIILWRVTTGSPVKVLKGHTSGVFAIAMIGGSRLVSGSHDSTIRVWDIESGETLRVLGGFAYGGIRCIAVLDHRRFVSGSSNGDVCLWDINAEEPLEVFQREYFIDGKKAGYQFPYPINSVTVVDRNRVVTVSQEKSIRIWQVQAGFARWRLLVPSDPLTVAKIDASRIVVGFRDGKLSIWDVDVGKCLRVMTGHTDQVSAVASVDSRYVVSAANDSTVRIWDVESGQIVATFVLDAPATAVSWHAPMKAVVVGDAQGGVHFLDWNR